MKIKDLINKLSEFNGSHEIKIRSFGEGEKNGNLTKFGNNNIFSGGKEVYIDVTIVSNFKK